MWAGWHWPDLSVTFVAEIVFTARNWLFIAQGQGTVSADIPIWVLRVSVRKLD